MRLRSVISLIIIAGCGAGASQSDSSGGRSAPAVFRGSTSLQIGQIQECGYNKTSQPLVLKDVWLTRMLVNVGAEMTLGENLTIRTGFEGKLWHNTFPREAIHVISNYLVPAMEYDFYFDRADGLWSLNLSPDIAFEGQLGLFPYKYNPDARNLGEFLFRSGTYPAFILGEFDYPLCRLAGVRAGVSLWEKLRTDILLTTEIDLPPFGDLSLSGLVEYEPWKFIAAQAGVCFSHLISVRDSATTPPDYNNMYVADNGDTAHYTFRGTKIMGRLVLDPKRIFLRENTGIFGENDGRLYVEAAILGVKDYPAFEQTNPQGYDELKQKLAVLMGVTVPCFKILDVLAVEAEWFDSRYPNNYNQVSTNGFPLPARPFAMRDTMDYKRDAWKWSVYAKRSFGDHFSLVFQAARDHLRHLSQFVENKDREEMFSKDEQWYWMVQARFAF